MICSFFGHSKIDDYDAVYKIAYDAILQKIVDGFRIFYFGGFGDFDFMCHKIVSKIKYENPQYSIQRIFCVPQEKDLRKLKAWQNKDNYEEIIYLQPNFDYWYKSIYYRNCAMIDNSSHIIFYVVRKCNSGAYKALSYAKSHKKEYTLLK